MNIICVRVILSGGAPRAVVEGPLPLPERHRRQAEISQQGAKVRSPNTLDPKSKRARTLRSAPAFITYTDPTRGVTATNYPSTPLDTSDSPDGVRTVPLRLLVPLRQLTCGRKTDWSMRSLYFSAML